ncbi:hypothetical protein [Pseudomarimonas arenosa]|uniref:Uncharacterized protein n=1 Tax=Pseudomarimonas arenosa TaxID=2774145 RepID=A0AAW3ZPZ9_9GAMM|nr:hypothetical protein [Pseudomarimonas arenosa]MBD8526709.1 hypothetical protein [Pseudomarimonas arenosa]
MFPALATVCGQLCCWLFLLLLSLTASASDISIPDLSPTHYASASGDYVVRIDPSTRNGAGSASYQLLHRGQRLWSQTLPYTLRSAAVTDRGMVAGFGYSNGLDAAYRDLGQFIVAIIDHKGQTVADHRSAREPSRFLHTLGDPKGAGLFVDADNDRLVIRIADSDRNAGAESWWIYRLSSGERIGQIRPKQLMQDAQLTPFIFDAQALPGTPLTLIHWYRADAEAKQFGARFSLVDLDGKPVWSIDFSDDYTAPGDTHAQRKLLQRIRQHGAILNTASAPPRFTLRAVSQAMLISYQVTPSSESAGGWRVEEVARAADLGFADSAPDTQGVAVQEQALQHLGRIELLQGERRPSPIRRVIAFDIDDKQRLGFLRQCDCPHEIDLVFIDQHGGLLGQWTPAAITTESSEARHHLTWISGNRWLWVRSEYGIGKRSSAAWVDAQQGLIEPIAEFNAAAIESLHRWGDGGFVALINEPLDGSRKAGLSAFGPDGLPRWTIAQSYQDPTQLFSPQDVAVTTEADVVVLEGVSKALKRYDQNGLHVDSVDLRQSWGRTPNYLAGLEANRDGGVIVYDFDGSPSMVDMALDGRVIAAWTPKFSDGRRFSPRGNLKQAADGSRWTSDGESLLRLDDKGVVDRVLGRRPDAAGLDQIAALQLDADQRIYAADQRSGSVHVFDPQGQWLRTCRPDVSDFASALSLPSMTVTDAGEIYLSRQAQPSRPRNGFVHFDRDCQRVGIAAVPLEDEVSQGWYSQPGSTNRWVLGFRNAYLVDPDGSVLRQIDRTADEQWLDIPGPAGTAPDGSIAIVSGASSASALDPRTHPPLVTVYAANGDAQVTWPAPSGLVSWAGDVAFDRQRLAFVTRHPDSASKHGHPNSVVVTDSHGNALFRFSPPHPLRSVYLVPGSGSSELWIFDGKTGIERYAMP